MRKIIGLLSIIIFITSCSTILKNKSFSEIPSDENIIFGKIRMLKPEAGQTRVAARDGKPVPHEPWKLAPLKMDVISFNKVSNNAISNMIDHESFRLKYSESSSDGYQYFWLGLPSSPENYKLNGLSVATAGYKFNNFHLNSSIEKGNPLYIGDITIQIADGKIKVNVDNNAEITAKEISLLANNNQPFRYSVSLINDKNINGEFSYMKY